MNQKRMRSKSILFSFIILILTIGCGGDEKSNPAGPGNSSPGNTNPPRPSAPTAKISASTTSGTAPFEVTFTDVSTGEITSRKWEFHNGQTSSSNQATFRFTQAGSFTERLTVQGPGGSSTTTISIRVTNPQPQVTLSDLKYVFNNSSREVTLTVDVNFKEYASQPRVLGVYWLRTCGADFCFQNSNCSTNTPGRHLGYLQVLTPSSNNATFNDVGANFSYSCFPDRSRGATYYGYAVVYDRIDLNAVTDVNNPALAKIGPPSKLVTIVWQ